jgi:multiple sugar transport system permease protein
MAIQRSSFSETKQRKGFMPAALSLRRRDALYGYLFVAPQVLGFLLIVLLPLLAVLVFSTQQRNLLSGAVTPVGLDNYAAMFSSDPFFGTVLRNSLVFTAVLVPLNVVLALLLALLLTQKLRGIIIFRTLFFAPVVTSAVAWAVVWRFLLQENSGINALLALVGVDGPNWLREPNWAMFSVIVTRVLKNVGLNMVIFMAALQNIPEDYSEAAKVDGANLWQRVWHIIVPLLSPTIVLVVLITIIGSLKAFDHILLMTGGGPANATNVLVYYIYFQAFKIFQTGYASALAVVLFVITFALTIAQWLVRRRFVYNED